jgi:hypothetical protein
MNEAYGQGKNTQVTLNSNAPEKNTRGKLKRVDFLSKITSERWNPHFEKNFSKAKEEVKRGVNVLQGRPSGTRYRGNRAVAARTPENARRNAIRLAQEEGTYPKPKRHWCDPRSWLGCGGTRRLRKIKRLTRKWKKIGRLY